MPNSKLEDFRFPAAIIFAIAFFTPVFDHLITGGFSTVTYVVEALCFGAVALFVGAVVVRAIYRAIQKARGK